MSVEPARPARAGARRVAGFVIGTALLLAAGWAVWRGGGSIRVAWAAASSRPALIPLAIMLPLANWVVVSLSFWVLMRRHGRVGAGEMTLLIGAAWLLNYLPLRAGMVGRVAYHKAVNRIAVGDSVRVMVINLACGAAATGLTLGLAVVLARASASAWVWGVALGAPAAGLVAWGAAGGWRGWLPSVLLLRYADVLIWVARYWVVFRLTGTPIDLPAAAAVTAACQVALAVPIVGNGLGVREWAVGLTAAALPAALVVSPMTTTQGLTADLANRAAELVVALPVGIVSAVLLARRRGLQAAGAGVAK
ncbi:MAG: hypothetical protein ACKVW3_00520 [Phycisphaerales bacterium]